MNLAVDIVLLAAAAFTAGYGLRLHHHPPHPEPAPRAHGWPKCTCGGQTERIIRIYNCGRIMAYSRANGLYRATPCVPQSRYCPLCRPGDPCTLHDGREPAHD
jgi:hypothetical protein